MSETLAIRLTRELNRGRQNGDLISEAEVARALAIAKREPKAKAV